MTLQDLSKDEREWIRQALLAIVRGPFVPDDGEVHTLTGLWRHEIRAVAESWPCANDEDEGTMLAINGALNTLLYYPHKQLSRWSEFLSASPAELAALHDKWRRLRGLRDAGAGGNFFRRLT